MGLGTGGVSCNHVQRTITIHIYDRSSGLTGQPTHHRIWIAPEVVIMHSLQNQFATLPNPGEVNQYDITDRRLPLPARGNVTWKRVANQAYVMTVEVRETIAGHRTDAFCAPSRWVLLLIVINAIRTIRINCSTRSCMAMTPLPLTRTYCNNVLRPL